MRLNARSVRRPNHARRASCSTVDIVRLIHKLVLVASIGFGAVAAAGIGFVSYGFFMYFGSSWVDFFLSAAGVPYYARVRVVGQFLTPEAWLYYAPCASVFVYITGIAIFCSLRSLLLLRRKRANRRLTRR